MKGLKSPSINFEHDGFKVINWEKISTRLGCQQINHDLPYIKYKVDHAIKIYMYL